MKFENISFNVAALKGMSKTEFDANVAHHFPEHPEKIAELYTFINGDDQKPERQLPEVGHIESDPIDVTDDAA